MTRWCRVRESTPSPRRGAVVESLQRERSGRKKGCCQGEEVTRTDSFIGLRCRWWLWRLPRHAPSLSVGGAIGGPRQNFRSQAHRPIRAGAAPGSRRPGLGRLRWPGEGSGGPAGGRPGSARQPPLTGLTVRRAVVTGHTSRQYCPAQGRSGGSTESTGPLLLAATARLASLARATIRSHRNGGNVPGAGTIRASGEKVSRGSLQRNWSYARQLVEAPIPRHGWPLKFRTRTTSQRRLSSRPYTSPEHSSGRPQQWRPCSSSPGTGPCSSAARRSQAPTSATRTVGEAAPVMTAHAC